MLVASGYPVNLGNQLGQAAIHIASIHGQLEAIRALLEVGADPNLPNRRGTVPLHFAARGKRNVRECVALLLQAGANPDVIDMSGLRPFEMAEDDVVREMLGVPYPTGAKIQSAASSRLGIELSGPVPEWGFRPEDLFGQELFGCARPFTEVEQHRDWQQAP